MVDTDSSGPFAAVAIVAERDIAVGEELLFDCARRFQLDASHHELIAPRTPKRILQNCTLTCTDTPSTACSRWQGVLGRAGSCTLLTAAADHRLFLRRRRETSAHELPLLLVLPLVPRLVPFRLAACEVYTRSHVHRHVSSLHFTTFDSVRFPERLCVHTER